MRSWATADRGKTKNGIKQATHKLLRGIRISRLQSKAGTPVKVAARAMMIKGSSLIKSALEKGDCANEKLGALFLAV
jgi:hypothetical protein